MDGRLAGLISWEAIVDRTRRIRELSTWSSPSSIIYACANQFRLPRWDDQPYYVEVWVEKDALLNVIQLACDPWQVPYMACRGYASLSELWQAGVKRFKERLEQDPAKACVIIYLGDHDPSGLDMPRNIQEQMDLFTENPGGVEVERIALTKEQIEEYEPPPNPAKTTDIRFKGYAQKHGTQSWELDALDPLVIRDLIDARIQLYLDFDLWESSKSQEEKHRADLQLVSNQWDAVVKGLRKK